MRGVMRHNRDVANGLAAVSIARYWCKLRELGNMQTQLPWLSSAMSWIFCVPLSSKCVLSMATNNLLRWDAFTCAG